MKPQELQFKNIIVALDFSKFSRSVLKQASFLAERFKAHLHVVHVAEEPVFLAPPHFFANGFNYVPPREEQMQEDLVRFYKFSGKHPVSLVFEFGSPAEQIMKLADTLENPLIVAGATGRSAISRFVLGSQAEKLALEASCPVWIHRGNKIRHFKYLLLPVDFSANTQKVIDLFKASPVPLRLNYLYIREPVSPVLDYPTYVELEKSMKKQTAEFVTDFKKKNAGVNLKVVEGDVVDEITSRSKNYDAIVMNPHNKTKVFHRFGKVTSKVIRLASVPVIVLKP